MKKKQKNFKRKLLLVFGLIIILSLLYVAAGRTEGFLLHERLRVERVFKHLLYFGENQLANVLNINNEIILVPVPYHHQEHALTCEVAALRMALNYQGNVVNEEELLGMLNFDTQGAMTAENIWGDPDKGFVGNVDGSIFERTGYGVYDQPILNLAKKFGDATVIKDANLTKVLTEVSAGNPVVVWGLLSRRKPVTWWSKEGKFITAYPGEHARVLIGYSGNIENPDKVILMDPIYGKIRMNTTKFLSDWKVLNNRAVVVYK